ncbi:hypothetical protein TYRP_009250 [Tyrophagus putrescentiae]|nr:hypothetical protein TYRP_009250 [Tyrophagus putrescentiae]
MTLINAGTLLGVTHSFAVIGFVITTTTAFPTMGCNNSKKRKDGKKSRVAAAAAEAAEGEDPSALKATSSQASKKTSSVPKTPLLDKDQSVTSVKDQAVPPKGNVEQPKGKAPAIALPPPMVRKSLRPSDSANRPLGTNEALSAGGSTGSSHSRMFLPSSDDHSKGGVPSTSKPGDGDTSKSNSGCLSKVGSDGQKTGGAASQQQPSSQVKQQLSSQPKPSGVLSKDSASITSVPDRVEGGGKKAT